MGCSFSYPVSFTKSRHLVEAIRCKRESLVHVLQAQSQLLIRTRSETLSVAVKHAANQVVRPLESIAETQPQLQPPLLRFPDALRIVVHQLRRRSVTTGSSCGEFA